VIQRRLLIGNQLGLHARAAAKLVNCASRFESHIMLTGNGREVNAKSIMGVMMLAASQGTELELTADGTDAEAATMAIIALIDDNFGEEQ